MKKKKKNQLRNIVYTPPGTNVNDTQQSWLQS